MTPRRQVLHLRRVGSVITEELSGGNDYPMVVDESAPPTAVAESVDVSSLLPASSLEVSLFIDEGDATNNTTSTGDMFLIQDVSVDLTGTTEAPAPTGPDGFAHDDAGRPISRTVNDVATALTWDVTSSLVESEWPSVPAVIWARHSVTCESYNRSRRSTAPLEPTGAASYSAVNDRRAERPPRGATPAASTAEGVIATASGVAADSPRGVVVVVMIVLLRVHAPAKLPDSRRLTQVWRIGHPRQSKRALIVDSCRKY